MSEKLRAHLSILFVNLIYGANYSIARLAMPQFISPSAFILLRAIVATVLFFILDRSIPIRKPVERKDYFNFFLLGLFGVAINQLLFFEGLSRTSNINAALIMTSTPILVSLIAWIILKDRLRMVQVAGILCGLSGAVILILQYQEVTGRAGSIGDLMILINAASYALYLVRTKPMIRKYDPWQVIKWPFLFGTLLILPFGATSLATTSWELFPTQAWISVVYVLLFTTFLAYLLNAQGLKHLSPSVVSYYIYLQPLFATLIALSLTHEKISVGQGIACLLLFTGVYLVNHQAFAKVKS